MEDRLPKETNSDDSRGHDGGRGWAQKVGCGEEKVFGWLALLEESH